MINEGTGPVTRVYVKCTENCICAIRTCHYLYYYFSWMLIKYVTNLRINNRRRDYYIIYYNTYSHNSITIQMCHFCAQYPRCYHGYYIVVSCKIKQTGRK